MAPRKKDPAPDLFTSGAPELRVTAVEIRDVLGAKEFRMAPGQVTVLAGSNGSGKSTALQAVQAALGRGSLARLARIDPDGKEVSPEAVVVLDGPAGHFRVERSAEELRVRRRVGDSAALEDVPRPQEFLSSLYDGAAANPVAFLQAKDDQRALMLLEALPLAFDRADLLTAMGTDASTLPPIPAGLHPLEEIGMIRDAVFRARTGVNRDQKSKAGAADQVRRNAPAEIPADPGGAVEKAQAKAEALAVEIAQDEARADSDERRDVAGADSAFEVERAEWRAKETATIERMCSKHDALAAEIRAEAEARIAEALAGVNAGIDKVRLETTAEVEAAAKRTEGTKALVKEARANARKAEDEKREWLTAARVAASGLQAQRENAAAALALHAQAKQFDDEAEALEKEANRLTVAIETLDGYRRKMASDLPIAGLEIEGKEIRVGGIPYDQLNTAARVAIAVKVSALRSQGRPLPLLFVDGAEALDSEHFSALVEELRTQKVQAFVCRVADHPLAVETGAAA